jgi:hypothetical protein
MGRRTGRPTSDSIAPASGAGFTSAAPGGGRPNKMRCLLGPGAHCRHFRQSRYPSCPWDHQGKPDVGGRPNPLHRPIESESSSIAADESIVHKPETGRVLQLVPPSRP